MEEIVTYYVEPEGSTETYEKLFGNKPSPERRFDIEPLRVFEIIRTSEW